MRDMTPADVDAVLSIEQTVQAFPWTRGNFVDALGHGDVCRVDELDGDIRGYAVLRLLPDEAELLNICVAAEYQRRGLGYSMLREMLEVARGRNTHRVLLEVRPSNTVALALYRSIGFREIGVRRSYYQNANGNENAITMAYELMDGING